MKTMKTHMMIVAAACLAIAGAAGAQQPAAGQAWLAELQSVEVRELSESEMKNMLAAMEEIEAMEGEIDTDTPDMFSAITANSEAMGVLKRNDFSAESFQSTVQNVVLAMGALALEAEKAQLDQAIAQLEAMKGQIPEAQYKYMEEQVLGTIRLFERAPESNVRLVEKYRDELESLGE